MKAIWWKASCVSIDDPNGSVRGRERCDPGRLGTAGKQWTELGPELSPQARLTKMSKLR